MFFQPAILALLLMNGLTVLALGAAMPFAWQILRCWHLESGSALQLRLERRTYLFSALLALCLTLQLAGLLLFVFNANRMAEMFVGAMCAVGSLQVDRWGFPALIAQLMVFFAASQWLIVNHLDNQAPDYPLVRLKYGLLLGLAPLFMASFALQFAYFKGLRADVITSCCGSLFSEARPGVAGELAATLAPGRALLLFYAAQGAALLSLAFCALRPQAGRFAGLLAGLASLWAGLAALRGIIDFLSLYIYEHPHHHCPFCILKPEYGYRGYALYLPLLLAVACGLGVGLLQLLPRPPSLAVRLPAYARRLAGLALVGFILFIGLASGMIWQSRLTLLEP